MYNNAPAYLDSPTRGVVAATSRAGLIGLALVMACSVEHPVDACQRLQTSYELELQGSAPYTAGKMALAVDRGKAKVALELTSESGGEPLRVNAGGRCLMGDVRVLIDANGTKGALVGIMEPDVVSDPIGYFELHPAGASPIKGFWRSPKSQPTAAANVPR